MALSHRARRRCCIKLFARLFQLVGSVTHSACEPFSSLVAFLPMMSMQAEITVAYLGCLFAVGSVYILSALFYFASLKDKRLSNDDCNWRSLGPTSRRVLCWALAAIFIVSLVLLIFALCFEEPTLRAVVFTWLHLSFSYPAAALRVGTRHLSS